ncbi:DUF3243 domain-containing protein [Bacillus sp. FJAT-42376]|uniref:DUF3243 domain-containing protein n=1 Tax=Bacillus sp. FJAT-42376 TaxID=2014076 RepID=UPI000F50EFDE|nr:DUF3243 domain-containing protein [Bacillus sp. FJAT-42376]AZB42434.1 DUF3243 domain-containing protein [Bacillus sp. FJAT-42376]
MANINNVEEKVDQMDSEKKDRILQDFEQFKSYLSDKVSKGEKLGLGEEQLAKAAEKVADYLAKHEEPRNSEEYLLYQLWKVGDKEQQHALAHMLVRMVK